MDYNNYNNNENDADLRRKKVLDELNNNDMKREGLDSNIQSFGTTAKKSSVSFSKKDENSYPSYNYSDSSNTSNNQIDNGNNNGSNGKLVAIFAIGILAMLVVYFLPIIKEKVDEYQIKREESKIEKKAKETSNSNKTTVKELKVTDEEVTSINYPVLHVDKGSKTTYLSNKKVTVNDISNNDLIFNSFITRESLLEDYKGGYSSNYCGGANNKKLINAFYIEGGINGIFGKKATFKKQNFVVPTNNGGTSYAGLWIYNKTYDYYVYMGDCSPKKTQTLYYDIVVPYDVKGETSNEILNISVKVGFATVNKANKTYSLYSDASYSNKVTSGSLTSNNIESELKQVISNSKDSYKDYVYRFTKNNCPYREYCFVSAEMK